MPRWAADILDLCDQVLVARVASWRSTASPWGSQRDVLPAKPGPISHGGKTSVITLKKLQHRSNYSQRRVLHHNVFLVIKILFCKKYLCRQIVVCLGVDFCWFCFLFVIDLIWVSSHETKHMQKQILKWNKISLTVEKMGVVLDVVREGKKKRERKK